MGMKIEVDCARIVSSLRSVCVKSKEHTQNHSPLEGGVGRADKNSSAFMCKRRSRYPDNTPLTPLKGGIVLGMLRTSIKLKEHAHNHSPLEGGQGGVGRADKNSKVLVSKRGSRYDDHTPLKGRIVSCAFFILLFVTSIFAQERHAASLANNAILSDNFSTPRLNTQNWVFGNHPNNHTLVQNGALTLRSIGKTSGWIHTREKFSLRERLVQIKILQPNGDGALGISPTVTSASAVAFSSEQNFYRFYTARDETSGPFRLYVQWRKGGLVEGLEVAPEIEVTPDSYLRLLVREDVIHFQFSFDGANWQTVYAETFALPGFTLNDRFYIEIAAGYTQHNGDWLVDDFVLRAHEETAGADATKENVVLNDPLRGRTLAARTGGAFMPEGGWQAVSREDMLVYDLGRYIASGALEITVRNFYPPEQNTAERHHFLAMFRNPWGSHHSVETQETFWDLHTGTMYAPGVKLQSSTNYADEKASIIKNSWKKEASYKLRVTWSGKELQYFRDGALQARHTHDAPMQLRYIFLGRDYTVSGDLITNFNGNQYPAFAGPIFSTLLVTANVVAQDNAAPLVENVALAGMYANAARLQWTTNEPAQCALEYGTTPAYGEQTPVLGPPAEIFSTTLPKLAANQTYHYRIVAVDDAGNRAVSTNATFTTMKSGLYLFQPSADTYVEKNNIYGERRAYGNFGWMNLLASDGRECYLRFNVAGLNGEVARAGLRLHGRQAGKGGGKLRVLQAAWEENAVTWQTKPHAEETDLGYIDAVHAGEWQSMALREVVTGNGVYDFALLGMGETVSFDTRESTNHAPELIVALRENDATAPVLSEVAATEIGSTSAVLTWRTNEPATAMIAYGLEGGEERSVADSADFAFTHRLVLRQLLPYKKYNCRVYSFDAAGNHALAAKLQFETLPARVEQVALHEVFEAHFLAAHAGASPYVNGPELTLTFTGTAGAALGKVIHVSGFWDGKNVYLARFAPPASGTWAWQTQASDAGMHGQRGTLTCAGNLPAEHISSRGPVQSSKLFPATLASADSTPFFLLGAQLRSALNVSLPSFQKYVAARAEQGCNFLQIAALEQARGNNPETGEAFFANEGERLNPDYWRRLDERVAYANAHGMVAGLTLLPKASASYFTSAEQVQRYMQYVVRRYSAFNVMWLLDEMPEGPAFARASIIAAIRAHDPAQHVLVLPHGIAPEARRAEVAFMLAPEIENQARAGAERRIALQPLIAGEKEPAEILQQHAWESVMRGQYLLLTEETPLTFTEENLYPSRLSFLPTLKDFWASDIHHAVPWWKFTRFETLERGRWRAGQPGEAYVVYCAAAKEFKLDLSEMTGEIRGEWYNTRTGRWSTAFSGPPSRNFALKPPGEGYAAFLWVYRN